MQVDSQIISEQSASTGPLQIVQSNLESNLESNLGQAEETSSSLPVISQLAIPQTQLKLDPASTTSPQPFGIPDISLPLLKPTEGSVLSVPNQITDVSILSTDSQLDSQSDPQPSSLPVVQIGSQVLPGQVLPDQILPGQALPGQHASDLQVAQSNLIADSPSSQSPAISQVSTPQIQPRLDRSSSTSPQPFSVDASSELSLPLLRQTDGAVSSPSVSNSDSQLASLSVVQIGSQIALEQTALAQPLQVSQNPTQAETQDQALITATGQISAPIQPNADQPIILYPQPFSADSAADTPPLFRQTDGDISSVVDSITNASSSLPVVQMGSQISPEQSQSSRPAVSPTISQSSPQIQLRVDHSATSPQPFSIDSSINLSLPLLKPTDSNISNILSTLNPVTESLGSLPIVQTGSQILPGQNTLASNQVSSSADQLPQAQFQNDLPVIQSGEAAPAQVLQTLRQPSAVQRTATPLMSVKQMPIVQINAEFASPQLEPLVLSQLPIAQQKAVISGGSLNSQSSPNAAGTQKVSVHPSQPDRAAVSLAQSTVSNAQTTQIAPVPIAQASQVTQVASTKPNLSSADIDQLAEKVERKLMRKFAVEGERRGQKKWR